MNGNKTIPDRASPNLMMTSSNGNNCRVTGPLCGAPVTGEFPSQRPVTQSFDIVFHLRLINGSVNNREAGDLRRHHATYDATVLWNYFISHDSPISIDDGFTPWIDFKYHRQSLSICSVPFLFTPQTSVPYVKIGSTTALNKCLAILGGKCPNFFSLHFMVYVELLALEHRCE